MPKNTKELSKNERKNTETIKKTAKKIVATKKESSSFLSKKKITSQKTSLPSKSTIKKTTVTTKKIIKKQPLANASNIEYYDLPYRYHQTVIKILAQTPKILFVYWDISDEDRKKYETIYGENFFTTTKPVLIVHNVTMNYSFEVEINDFANSWYLTVNDANCKYLIELGRRPIPFTTSSLSESYIQITSSNHLESPNDHILFERFNPSVSFKNVKTEEIKLRDFSNIMTPVNKRSITNLANFYQDLYEEEVFEEMQKLNNPTSAFK